MSSIRYSLVQSQQQKHQNNVWNLLNEVVLVSLCLTLNRFHTLHGVSIIDFEQVKPAKFVVNFQYILRIIQRINPMFVFRILNKRLLQDELRNILLVAFFWTLNSLGLVSTTCFPCWKHAWNVQERCYFVHMVLNSKSMLNRLWKEDSFFINLFWTKICLYLIGVGLSPDFFHSWY